MDINAPIGYDTYKQASPKNQQPIAVCLELPAELSDKEARVIISSLLTLVKQQFNVAASQRWVHRWDPKCGSSPVFYCP